MSGERAEGFWWVRWYVDASVGPEDSIIKVDAAGRVLPFGGGEPYDSVWDFEASEVIEWGSYIGKGPVESNWANRAERDDALAQSAERRRLLDECREQLRAANAEIERLKNEVQDLRDAVKHCGSVATCKEILADPQLMEIMRANDEVTP